MKIGIVLAKPPGYSETFFRSKIAGLIQHGHEVYLFVNSKGSETIPGVKIKSAPPVFGSPVIQAFVMGVLLLKLGLLAPRKVKALYHLQKEDGEAFPSIFKSLYLNSHILTCNLDWLHFGFATLALGRENVAKAMGAQMAVSLRGFDIAVYPLKHSGCYKKLWPRVDKIHVISDELKMKLYEAGFSNNCEVVKITPAIHFQKFYKERTVFKSTGVLRILTVGRLHWIKGLEYGLQALLLLKKRGVRFVYSIAGAGEEEERLKFAAHQLGLTDQIEFKGTLSSEEVIKEMHRSDIYLQPSIHEGFCNAALEAQAAGCLCVVTNVGGLKENVMDGETGWVVPSRLPSAVAQKIEEAILLSQEKKHLVVAQAQKRVRELYSTEGQVQKFLDFYEK